MIFFNKKMCGILAIHLRKQEQNINRIFNGWNILSNRGPDDGTFSVTSNLILGFKPPRPE